MNELNDSELIALYHEGKLDGESMNQLERRALSDPFLADAMEGFSQVKKPRLHLKKDLRERLEKRLHKNKRRSILGQTSAWAAAAAIVLAVGATWFWFHEEKENRIVQIEAAKPAPVITQNDTVKQAAVSEAPVIALAPEEKEAVKSVVPRRKKPATIITELPDSVLLGDVAVVAYATQQKKDMTGSVAQIPVAAMNRNAAGLSEPAANISLKKSEKEDGALLKGKVVSADDGRALPGVNLILQGKNTGTVTDANGEFTIAAEKKDVVDASYVGYKKSEQKVGKNDSMLIAMQPDNTALSEVVVVGYGKQKSIKKAEPRIGWKAYRTYLEEKAVISDTNNGGRVILEFSIDKNGIPADFSIVKSYSKEAAEKAEEILKSGSRWQAASTQKTERIRISIRFRNNQ